MKTINIDENLLDTPQFDIDEAYEFLCSHVIRTEHSCIQNPPIDLIGFIAGVITLNEEVEVLVKFPDELLQLNKASFSEKISLVEMP